MLGYLTRNLFCIMFRCLPYILFLGFVLLAACQGQPDGAAKPVSQPPTALANGPSNATPWEQKYAAAAAAQHLTPAFGVFYTDSTGQFYRSYTEASDADPESEAQAFVVFDKCPALDSATYHDVDSSEYSADKNGVYYFCFNGHEQSFEAVTGADPATFQSLPGLEAGHDRSHVFLRATQLPALKPDRLRVYEGPDNRPTPCGADDLYFTDGRVVVKNEALLTTNARTFRPPTAYKRVYSVKDI